MWLVVVMVTVLLSGNLRHVDARAASVERVRVVDEGDIEDKDKEGKSPTGCEAEKEGRVGVAGEGGKEPGHGDYRPRRSL